jgi:regulator of sigma E protease
MGSVLGIIVGLVGLGFLILAHETGHFVAAKAFGMRVEEFSIGFGRFIVSRRIGETIYGVSWFPLGGYVRVTGMHREEFEARVAAARDEEWKGRRPRDPEAFLTGPSGISDSEAVSIPESRRYYAKPLWRRVIFLVSGVTMNVVVAFFLLFIVGLQGYFVPSTTVSEVVPESAAAAADVRPGDRLVSIAGQAVDEWEDVQAVLAPLGGETVPLVLEREGAFVDRETTLGDREGRGFLGVAPELVEREATVGQALNFAGTRVGSLMTLFFREVGRLFSGEQSVVGTEGPAGPIGIISISSEAVRGGYYLSLLAFISLQLAILNLLPLLPLDGGHVAVSLVERVLRRRISLRVFERISMVGIALFLLLFLVATGNDLARLLGGGFSGGS